ncbi:hypothetical protein VXQ18_06060 [Brucella abortus]|nr:hypothetical protein [Brucella abortus]
MIEAGHEVVVVDNFDNSHPEALHRIERITGRAPPAGNRAIFAIAPLWNR